MQESLVVDVPNAKDSLQMNNNNDNEFVDTINESNTLRMNEQDDMESLKITITNNDNESSKSLPQDADTSADKVFMTNKI